MSVHCSKYSDGFTFLKFLLWSIIPNMICSPLLFHSCKLLALIFYHLPLPYSTPLTSILLHSTPPHWSPCTPRALFTLQGLYTASSHTWNFLRPCICLVCFSSFCRSQLKHLSNQEAFISICKEYLYQHHLTLLPTSFILKTLIMS